MHLTARICRTAASRMAGLVLAFGVCVGLVALTPPPSMAAEELNWHLRAEDAMAAAVKSGKPVYLYIFDSAKKDPTDPCKRMRAETFPHPAVIALLNKNFECCAIDASVIANAAIAEKYAWNVFEADTNDEVYDREYKTQFGSMPAHAFVNAKGEPYFTFWGFTPASTFGYRVTQVVDLIRQKQAVDKDDTNARAHADLGKTLMELGDYTNCRKHLERAKALDTKNESGALEDSSLDLIVLSLPDDSVKGYEALVKFQKDFPQTKRMMEVRYWQAVSLAAQETPAKYRQALQVLAWFDKLDPEKDRELYRSRWAVEADKLSVMLKRALDAK